MDPMFYEQKDFNLFLGSICDHPFPLHVHDEVEIVCVTSGSLVMTVDGQQLHLEPGDISISFPLVPHSYDMMTPDLRGLSAIFAPDTIQEFSEPLRTMQPVSPFLPQRQQCPELRGMIHRMLEISFQHETHLQHGYLHLFLSYLFSSITLTHRERQVQHGLGCQALQYIFEHFTEPLTLESTARALGISAIHLSHLFSQQLNINFRQYINTLRVSRACSLLWNPSFSISQVAYLCGYGNQRTFNRAFEEVCHMQPKQYRAKLSHYTKGEAQSCGGEEDDGGSCESRQNKTLHEYNVIRDCPSDGETRFPR